MCFVSGIVCGGVRDQCMCFVSGVRCLWVRDVSVCLFCLGYKMFGVVRG